MKAELRKVAISIGVIVVVAVLLLQFYVSYVSFHHSIKEAKYFAADGSLCMYLLVHEDATADLYLFMMNQDEIQTGIKLEMDCYYQWHKPFLGNYYFTSESLLSFQKIEIDGDPGYITMKCTDAVCYDFFWGTESDSSAAIGEYTEEDVPFVFCDDNSFYLDGGVLPEVKQCPEKIEYYVNYLDSLIDN